MRRLNRVLPFVLFLMLLTLPTMLLAQEDLPQSFTSDDGMVTMRYPAGWTAEDDDGLLRFSGDGVFMQVSYYEYGENYTPLDVVTEGAPTFLDFSEPENLIFGGYDAVQSISPDQVYTVLNFCGGVLALAIGYASPAPAYEATFNAMLDTIQYGSGGAVSCRAAFSELAAITPANAAMVTQVRTLGDAAVAVNGVAFNLDGKQLAVAGADGNVTVWSMVSGNVQWLLEGHRGGATSVAFGSGGFQLVAGTGAGFVWMWDTLTGEVSSGLQRHDGIAESVAFTEDFLIASGGEDGSVRVWDMLDYAERTPLLEPNDVPVLSVAFSADGTLLAAASGNVIRVWDVEAATVVAELESEVSTIDAISFRPNGSALVYGGADTAAWVWDLAGDNRALLEGHDGQVNALAYSADGNLIASGDASGVRLWNAATGELLASAADGAVNSVAFSPDGTLVAAGGEAGGVTLWGTSGAGSAAAETTASESAAPEDTGETTEAETADTASAGATCSVSAPNNANLRGGPGTNFDVAGSLAAGQSAEVDGQAQGADGMTWYRLTSGAWVRSDIVGAPSACAGVAVVAP